MIGLLAALFHPVGRMYHAFLPYGLPICVVCGVPSPYICARCQRAACAHHLEVRQASAHLAFICDRCGVMQ